MLNLLTLFSPETIEEEFSKEWLPGFIPVNDFLEELIELLRKKNNIPKKEIIILPSEKICSSCNKSFPANMDHFYLNRGCLLSRCKTCNNKIKVEKRNERVRKEKKLKELIKKYYRRIDSEGSVSQAHKAIESLTLINVIKDIEDIINSKEKSEINNRLSGQERGE